MPTIELGNISVISMITDPNTGMRTKYRANHIDQSITHISIPPSWNLLETLGGVTNLWNSESDAPPAWVRCSEDPDLEGMLAKHFSCPVGQPDDWEIRITGEELLVPIADGFPNSEATTSESDGGEE